MFDYLARKRVFLGTIYLVIVWLFACPRPLMWMLGFGVALLGEGVRTWASGFIFKNETLAQDGPYSLLRNPLYFGSFFLGFGISLMSGRLSLAVPYPLLFLPIYIRRIEQEEQQLLQRFGDDATAYFRRVPRLIPSRSTFRSPAERWNLQRVLFEHREWGNWLLLAAFSAAFFAHWKLGRPCG